MTNENRMPIHQAGCICHSCETRNAAESLLVQPEQEEHPRADCEGCGDPYCPCQDGDPCHYEDAGETKAMHRLCPRCLGVDDGSIPKCDEYGGAGNITEPVAAVAAKEKEQWENECEHGRSLGGWCPKCGGIVHAVDLAGENPEPVAETKPTPSAPEPKSFLLPSFVAAMNDIGRYGYEKYADQSFQARAAAGDTSRSMDRTQPEAIRDHAAAHFQMHIDGTLHDHFGTRKHQLAAVAFNAMMEYYFAGLDSDECDKPQPDSSSIPEPEQVVDDEEIQAAIDDHKTLWSEEIAIELQQWRAWAKGQSNGR